MYELNYNNQVSVTGEIISGFTFNHEVYGERFHTFKIAIRRNSGNYDYIPIMISERDIDVKKDYIGQNILVEGQYRSFNFHEGTKSKLLLSVFVKKVEFLEEPISSEEANNIVLNGYICKKPIYRITPAGREIADLLLAVNRSFKNSDYIPCIAWGRDARYVGKLQVGQRIQIHGRIQSREYVKKFSEEESVIKTAYEVSVNNIRVVEEKVK